MRGRECRGYYRCLYPRFGESCRSEVVSLLVDGRRLCRAGRIGRLGHRFRAYRDRGGHGLHHRGWHGQVLFLACRLFAPPLRGQLDNRVCRTGLWPRRPRRSRDGRRDSLLLHHWPAHSAISRLPSARASRAFILSYMPTHPCVPPISPSAATGSCASGARASP